MANILFTWELGSGSGHVAPYLRAVRLLEARGHKVTFAMKNLAKAYGLFKDTDVRYLQAPATVGRVEDHIEPNNSYARILHNAGYNNPDRLTGLLTGWRNLFALVEPDIVIFDYSPTAMLASRDLGVPRLAIGTGFHLPPDMQPIPGVWYHRMKQDPARLQRSEDRVLAVINESAARVGLAPLSHLGELTEVDAKIFRTFRELDHYQQRTDGEYWGVSPSPAGATPEWPAAKGPRIFAYLKPFKTLPSLFDTLQQRKLPTLVYGDGLPTKLEKQYTSETLKFVKRPLDMKQIGETADLAIFNAGHGSACELLLAGVPSLMLPLHAEQELVAENVERLGAGLAAPKRKPEGMAYQLNRLLESDEYRRAAQSFAKRYAGLDLSGQAERLTGLIESLLTGEEPSQGEPAPAGAAAGDQSTL